MKAVIEQATIKHIPFIQRRLAPFKRIETEVIGRIIESPDDLVFVNPEKEVVCRIHHSVKQRTNHVSWLLPADEHRLDLYLTMAKTLVEVSHRFPEHDDFKTWARFKSRRGCLSIFDQKNSAKEITQEWHKLFPKSSNVRWRMWDNSWVIWGTHGEIVKDIQAYLNRPREVTIEPTAINA